MADASAAVGYSVRVTHDVQTDTTTIRWTETEPGPFNVYRGSRTSGVPWTYNQGCLAHGEPGPNTTETLTPAPGVTFFYLVSRQNPGCLESSLGQDSSGAERPNGSACPDLGGDGDGDLLLDQFDNCPLTFNPDQFDTDMDGRGDACDSNG